MKREGQEKEERNPLLEAKIRIPNPPAGEVSREGLVSEIEECPEDVIVLQAEAGFGKTTVMAELARRHSGHCSWYQADEMDNTPEIFFRGIIFAMAGEIALNIPKFCDSGQFYQFLSQIFLQIPSGLFYVCVNDFQMIHNEQIDRFFVKMMEYGRGKIRLILTVKGGFPKFLAACLMQGRVKNIGAQSLRFGRDETTRLLSRLAPGKLTGNLLADIQEYTAGWPAAVTFAGLDLKGGTYSKDRPFLFDTTYLYDYIFYEIFHRLPDDTQAFMMESSVLKKTEPDVCNYALERGDSARMLEYLVCENLFLSRTGTNKYCYDAVMADFLRHEIKPEKKQEIICRETEYYARTKAKQHALIHVTCLGEFEAAGAKGKVAWRTKKTKELFACLFFEEGRRMKKDTLVERLWPETDRQKASVLFYTTVSYLRKALAQAGDEEILVVKNQAYAVDISHIESDIGKLMDISRKMRAGEMPEEERILEMAELYHECYMYGEDYAWLGEYREYVEQLFLQTMEKYSQMQMERGKFAQAAVILKKAAEVDAYSISLLELLIECLLLTGDVKRAKRQYARLKRICEEELAQEVELEFRDYAQRARERRKNQC